MGNTTVELEGDVHVIKNVTGTRQLRDFYAQVVKNNWEKYVGITTQGIRYGYSTEKNAAIRLPDSQPFAYNPNYRASKVTKDEKEAVEAETIAQEEAISDKSISVPTETEYETDSEETIENLDDVDYKLLYDRAQTKINKCKKIAEDLQVKLKTQTERANLAEQQVTTLLQYKVTAEGNISKLQTELSAKVRKIEEMFSELKELREAKKEEIKTSNISTDALIKLLADKGYHVTISK